MIRLTNIGKSFYVNNQLSNVLSGINLHINKGDYIAINGPSGCGKTTLLSIIGLLDYPSCGEYILNDTNVYYYSEKELSNIRNQKIGFVFQNYNLINTFTILNNLVLPQFYNKHFSKDRILSIMDELGLSDYLNYHPTQLSGGQLQRVAIARALINNPELILADEPTGNLDNNNTNIILDLFDKIHSMGKTIIIVTHDINVAGRADKILKLVDGKFESLIDDGDKNEQLLS